MAGKKEINNMRIIKRLLYNLKENNKNLKSE